MAASIALVHVDWLTPEQGGRESLPTGSTYAATAYGAEERRAGLLSVVIGFIDPMTPESRTGYRAALRVLAPVTVGKKLVPGDTLVITEGPQPVARCAVLSVREERAA